MSWQQQRFKDADKQAMIELQYVVFTDLQNFIGILAETYAVTQQVERSDPLYLIHLNRLITQVNLSKCIHFDTQQSNQNKNNSQYLDLKKKSFNALNQFLQSFNMDYNPDLDLSLQDYKTILSNPVQNMKMKELHYLPDQGDNLNESVVSDLLGSISSVDNDYDQMRGGKKTFNFDENELHQKTQSRYKQALQKVQVYKSGQNKVQQPNYNRIEVEEQQDDQNIQPQKRKQNQENNRQQMDDNNYSDIKNEQLYSTPNVLIQAIEQVLNNKRINIEQETFQLLQYCLCYLQNQLDVIQQDKFDRLICHVKLYNLKTVNSNLKYLSEFYKSEELNYVLDKIWHLINIQGSNNQSTPQVETVKTTQTDKKVKGWQSNK